MGKFINTWKVNNTPVYSKVKEEIRRATRRYCGMSENENTTPPNLWGARKAGLEGSGWLQTPMLMKNGQRRRACQWICGRGRGCEPRERGSL